jgi:hypothetical protein
MHRFIRDCPQLLPQLLDEAGHPGFPEVIASKELIPGETTTVEPLERDADTALILTAGDGREFVLVGEAQTGGSKETIEKKRRNWPYYVGFLHEKYKLPVLLVVVCQQKATAKWAAKPIETGLDFFRTQTTRPLVLGPHNIPMPRVPIADDDLPVAAFGVITHGKDKEVGDILEPVARVLKNADPTTRTMLATNIWHALTPETTARTWMDLMKVMKLDEELLAELHRGSLGDVVSELEAKAEAKGEAKVIVRVLDKRGIELTEAQRERILGCVDLELLGRWLDASLDVTSADEIFG